MGFGWNKGKEVGKQLAGGHYVSLKNDGDMAKGVFLGEPFIRILHWIENKPHACTQNDHCPHCAAGDNPVMAFKVNFYDVVKNALKILEGPKKLFDAVIVSSDKYGFGKVFELKRNGTKGAALSFAVLYDGEITPELRARLDACKLFVLDKDGAPQQGAPATSTPTTAGGEVPTAPAPATAPSPALIAPAAAQELIGHLRNLPSENVAAFLATFRITKVRDLRAEDEEAARTYIENLVTPAANDASANDDPFAA
jgi:hypothetical protein